MQFFAVLATVLSFVAAADSEQCQFTLPEPVTSFGAEGVNDALFVYSGHIGRTHAHSQENLSSRFSRLDCQGVTSSLAMRDALQGSALVAHGNNVILVGGLRAFNRTAAEAEDLVSVRSVRSFDTAQDLWTELPPLPEPRSSHDAVVLNDVLYVVGGWTLRGKDLEPAWANTTLALDLAALDATDQATWRAIEQPFARRALAVTHDGERILAVGGIDANGTSSRVDVFDPSKGRWTAGPELPESGRLKGFGAAAEHFEGHAVVSLSDGSVHTPDGGDGVSFVEWKRVGKLAQPRFFHELAVVSDQLYAVGGTSYREHLDTVEQVTLDIVDTPATQPSNESGRPQAAHWSGFRQPGQLEGALQVRAVEWRTSLRGYGQSAPVAWQDRVFVTSSTGENLEEQHLSAFSLSSGEPLWQRSFAASERFESSDMIARAASTPAVDADRIYALFGSGDLVALDHNGEIQWQRELVSDYGSFGGNHGVGTSVVLSGDAVIVHIARKTYAYLLALDPSTGKTLWKTDRTPGPSWSTPVLADGGAEIVVSSSGLLEGFRTSDGTKLWSVDGMGGNNVSSPLVMGDLVAVAATRSGGVRMMQRPALAAEQGKVGHARLLWESDFTGHYGSPLWVNGCVLVGNSVGATVCYEPTTGVEHWRARLAGPNWATPIVDGDQRVVAVSEKGQLQVVEVSVEGLELIQQLDLGTEGRVYGMSVAGDRVLLRSGSELLAVR